MAKMDKTFDKTFLMTSLDRIDKQLKSKGIIERKYQNNTLSTLPNENHKTLEDNYQVPDLYSNLRTDRNSTCSNYLNTKYSNEYEVRKLIENELNPYISSVKSEFKNTIFNFREEVKEFYRHQIDLKGYQDLLSSYRVNTNKVESDMKFQFEQLNKSYFDLDLVVRDIRDRFSEVNRKVIQVNDELKNSTMNQALLSFLEEKVGDLDQRMNFNQIYRTIEERIMDQVNGSITELKRNYDMKIELLTKDKNNLEESNLIIAQENKKSLNSNFQLTQSITEMNKRITSLETENENNLYNISQLTTLYRNTEKESRNQNDSMATLSHDVNALKQKESVRKGFEEQTEEIRAYVNTNLNQIKKTLKSEIDEVHARISQTTSELELNLAQLTKLSESSELKENVYNLTEQTNTLQTQISQIKSDQMHLTNKLEDIDKENISKHDSASFLNESRFNKINEEIEIISSFFNEYKEEQNKLNEMYEQAMKALASQVFSVETETKTIREGQEGFEGNMETIQGNFERMKPVMDAYPKITNDFNVYTEIIKALMQNFEEIKNEVNNNFSSLSQWQTDLVNNVTNAVNELKQDYNEKFRQSNAVISIQSGRLDTKEENARSTEISKRMDQLQVLNDRKYVAKKDLEIFKKQMGEFEKILKDSNIKHDLASPHHHPNIEDNRSLPNEFLQSKIQGNSVLDKITYKSNVESEPNVPYSLVKSSNLKPNQEMDLRNIDCEENNELFPGDNEW